MFCYSLLLERARYLRKSRMLKFGNKVSFIIRSPIDWILQDVALHTIKDDDLTLFKNQVRVASISVIAPKISDKHEYRIRALSPIEVHSTFETSRGKKKTYYYSPFEAEFSDLVNKNAQKKWKAVFQQDCSHFLHLEPLFDSRKKETVILYGNGKRQTVIKGWRGRYKLNGDPEFLQFAIDAGLGSRNSQGFGCVEVG